MRRFLRRATRSTGGNVAIEFAMIAPLMLLLISGLTEFGFAFQAYNATNRLATQYAIAWADCSDFPVGTCQTELGSYTSAFAIANIVPQLKPARTTLNMFQVTMNGTSPVVTYAFPSGGSLNAAQTSAAQATFSDKQTGVIVSVTYSHSLMFFATLMTPYLSAYLTPAYTVAQLKS